MEIIKALMWEYYVRGWSRFLAAALGAIGIASFVYAAIARVGYAGGAYSELHFGFYWTTLFVIGAAVISAAGEPKLRFALPVDGRHLVLCLMACVATTTFVLYALIAIVLNATFDAEWPVWGPGLLGAIAVSWFFAILWATANSQLAQLIVSGLTVLSALLAALCFPAQLAPPWEMFENVELIHLAACSVAAAICAAVGVMGFNRLRRGNQFDPLSAGDALLDRLPQQRLPGPIRSPQAAQLKAEFAQRGYVLPAASVLLVGAALVALCLAPSNAPWYRTVLAVSVMPLWPAMIVSGIFFGARSKHCNFGSFNGTRPLTDRDIAAAVLKNVALAIGLTAGVYAIGGAAAAAVIGFREDWTMLGDVLQTHWVDLGRMAAGSLLTAWTLMGLMTSITLGGNRVMATALWIWLAGMITPALITPFLTRDAAAAFGQTYVQIACLAVVLLAIVVYISSYRRNLAAGSVLILAGICVAAALIIPQVTAVHLPAENILPLICLGMLLPLPWAAAPLAVAWNRHR